MESLKMHGDTVVTEDQEGAKSNLNKGKSNKDSLKINRGVELLLRNKRRVSRPKTFQVKFGNMVSFFNKEIEFYLDFHLDIRKSNSRGE
tara:strand:- start:577 stop:843 length:267 start_codon:yes stop_codon:yes gene_type:complete